MKNKRLKNNRGYVAVFKHVLLGKYCLFPTNHTVHCVLFKMSLLSRFFEHIQEVKPSIFVTYNGDSFDW